MGNRIDIAAEFIRRSQDAILIFDGHLEAWVPISQIAVRDDHDRPVRSPLLPGQSITVNMPEWLANKKGFI